MGDGGRSLDYVVFGIGFGATLLVLGLLIRDFGTRLRFRSPTGADGVFHAEELVARVSWSRFCGALGTVWATAGLAFVVITVIGMLFRISDASAGWVMGVSFVVLLVAIAFWTWAFFDRFGSYGILPERDVVVERGAIERVPISPKDEAAEETRDHDPPVIAVSGNSTVAPLKSETDWIAPGDDAVNDPTDGPSLPTPEERMAAATSPIDHESHEADLDQTVQVGGRPGRRSFRPAPPTGVPGRDDDVDMKGSSPSDADALSGEDSRRVDKPASESASRPESRPREA